MASGSSAAVRISTHAPAARKSSAMARKFSMCGPITTGFENSAGSRILWPPRSTSVPPMKTTSATENRPLSSPMVSRSSTPGSSSVSPSCRFDRRRCRTPAAASLAAVSSNAAGLRGARISISFG